MLASNPVTPRLRSVVYAGAALKLFQVCEAAVRHLAYGGRRRQIAYAPLSELSDKSLPALIWQGIKLGPRGVALQKKQFASALYIKAGFDAGLLRYVHALAERA